MSLDTLQTLQLSPQGAQDAASSPSNKDSSAVMPGDALANHIMVMGDGVSLGHVHLFARPPLAALPAASSSQLNNNLQQLILVKAQSRRTVSSLAFRACLQSPKYVLLPLMALPPIGHCPLLTNPRRFSSA